MGAEPSAEELSTVINVFDVDHDGQVSYKEFFEFLSKGKVPQDTKEGISDEEKEALRQFLLQHVFGVTHPCQLKDEAVRTVFKGFDADGNGQISKDEFRKAAVAMGAEPSAEELNTIVAVFDIDGNGMVSYAELNRFLHGSGDKLMAPTEADRENLRAFLLQILFDVSDPEELKEEDVKKAFDRFDVDGSGNISPEEFAALAEELGAEKDAPELARAVEIFDADGDGQVGT
jgi:Ca2+-binding EF-hand superfamily protein